MPQLKINPLSRSVTHLSRCPPGGIFIQIGHHTIWSQNESSYILVTKCVIIQFGHKLVIIRFGHKLGTFGCTSPIEGRLTCIVIPLSRRQSLDDVKI